MNIKDHYDNHLASFYSWMSGDFTEKQMEQQAFFATNAIVPNTSKVAIDLGAGHGLQSVSLAKLGFQVHAVDFNEQLLRELKRNCGDLDIHIVEDELIRYLEHTRVTATVITCMGDTLTHLESVAQLELFIHLIHQRLSTGGKIVLSFRDLVQEMTGTQRFIPVKSDENRILTCFLEYFPEHVIVHDILHEKKDGRWQQKVSAYPKLRLNEAMVTELLVSNGFKILHSQTLNRMIYLVGQK
jgi:protein-L-isoaspartate O-methyltransferase